MQTLELRDTRRYVGTYSHLDDWTTIGNFEVTDSESKLLDDEDICEPRETILTVRVESDATEEDIIQALKDSNSHGGCAHEHDCCGCTSIYVVDVEPVPGEPGAWKVRQTSSRNY